MGASAQNILDYNCFDDAPKLHQDITHFSIAGNMPVAQIALKFNVTPGYVQEVLSNPIIKDYIERMQDVRLFEQLDLMENLSDTVMAAAAQLKDMIKEKKLKPSELMKVIELGGDRVQRLNLTKQTKQIHQSDKEGVRKEVLSELKRLSAEAGNVIQYKPKQVEMLTAGEDDG